MTKLKSLSYVSECTFLASSCCHVDEGEGDDAGGFGVSPHCTAGVCGMPLPAVQLILISCGLRVRARRKCMGVRVEKVMGCDLARSTGAVVDPEKRTKMAGSRRLGMNQSLLMPLNVVSLVMWQSAKFPSSIFVGASLLQ